MKKILAMLLALVMVFSMLTVAVFAEEGQTGEETEDVETTPTVDVEPEEEEPTVEPEPVEPAEDENPGTGIVLAAVPGILAAAAAVVSKKH